MSGVTKALPTGWSKILDDVQERLDQAIASANARIELMDTYHAKLSSGMREQEVAQWSDRLQRLQTYLESAEQVVASVDQLLAKEETQLRQTQIACTTLRQRLAEQAGGAIG
jgi:hypothetical protein